MKHFGYNNISYLFVLMFCLLFNTTSSIAAVPSHAPFKKVFILIFENSESSETITQPTFASLSKQGAYLNNFRALTHPSQPNYIAWTSGGTQGVINDDPYNLDSKNIVDLLEAKGITWKVYVEDYPGDCYAGTKIEGYVRKHNPFISYNNIRNNPSRCALIVNAQELDKDIQAGTLPAYAFYIPNLKNDGHDTDVAFADTWLKNSMVPRLNNPAFIDDMLFILTFDEGDTKNKTTENKIYTLLYGNMVQTKMINDQYNPYNVLRTIEDAWNLGTLEANDKTASAMTGVFKAQSPEKKS